MGRSRATALMIALAGLACEGEDAVEVAMRARALVDATPQACARCHEEVVEAWQDSMHAHAWDDPVFRREYDARPLEWCRDCHAPPTSTPGRSLGVDCATCHVRDGEILAVSPSAAGMEAHPMRRAPELATPEHCGQCHQFAFRDDGMHDPEEALQNTLVEFYGSDASRRGKTCQSCHMTAGSHAFSGIHDPQMLARAVDIEVLARRTESGIEVEVELRGADIGHAFPTGDVFRRAVLRVRTASGAEDALELQRWLARTTDPDGEDMHVRTVDDTRVPAPGQGVLQETLQLPDDGATSVDWDLVLHRLPPRRAKAAGLDPDVVTRTVAHGEATVIEPPRG